MKRTSHILSVCFAVLIALTAQSAAVARTMPDASGQMVLCTGTGPVVVNFDESGEPMGPQHLCPECALTLIAALGEAGIEFAALGPWQRYEAVTVQGNVATLRQGVPKARGPPLLEIRSILS